MMLMTMITKQFSKQFILTDEKRRTYNITKDTFAKPVFSTSVGKKRRVKQTLYKIHGFAGGLVCQTISWLGAQPRERSNKCAIIR